MPFPKISKTEWVLFIGLLVYIGTRALTLSFVHDESLSFTIVNGEDTWVNTANNHWLNTQLMSIAHAAFGNSEFVLRLPNVLSFVLYALGFLLLFRHMKSGWLRMAAIGFFMLNPFLLEYFSLARGYGLSLAFVLPSLCFFLRNDFTDQHPGEFLKDLFWCQLFASLATGANLSMVNYQLASLAILSTRFSSLLFNRRFEKSQLVLAAIIFAGVGAVLSTTIQRLFQLKKDDQLYVGAESLYQSFQSLFESANYLPVQISTPFVAAAFGIYLVSVIILVHRQDRNSSFFQITLLNTFIIGGIWLEHAVFEANYPMERTALLYWPLVGLQAWHLFRVINDHQRLGRYVIRPLMILALSGSVINFLHGANITHTKTWRYDAHTKEAMNEIASRIEHQSSTATIGNHWLFEPAINYYIQKWGLNIEEANRDGLDTGADFNYALYTPDGLPGFTILEKYPEINGYLLGRLEP